MSGESDIQFFTVVAQRIKLSYTAFEHGFRGHQQTRAIEDRLWVRLMNRTTRWLDQTSEGEAFLLARNIVYHAATAEETISSARGEPKGLLRINATFQFGANTSPRRSPPGILASRYSWC